MPTTVPLNIETQGDREIVMTRAFNAPRPLVYDAFTRPELVSRWMGVFNEYVMATCEIDLRVGGRYRYVWTGPNAFRLGLNGVYREIVAPERLVYTESFEESWYAGEALNTCQLTEENGRTTVTITSLFESQEGRDTAMQSGWRPASGRRRQPGSGAGLYAGAGNRRRPLPSPRRHLRDEDSSRPSRAVVQPVTVRKVDRSRCGRPHHRHARGHPAPDGPLTQPGPVRPGGSAGRLQVGPR